MITEYLLNCGSLDIEFIDKELKNFEIDIEDIDKENLTDANSSLYFIYLKACEGIDEKRVSIFTNCLDSHLYIDGEEMYNKSDIDEIKEKIYCPYCEKTMVSAETRGNYNYCIYCNKII